MIQSAVEKYAQQTAGYSVEKGKSLGVTQLLRTTAGIKKWEDMTEEERKNEIINAVKKDFEIAKTQIEPGKEIDYFLDRALDPLDPMSGVYKIILQQMGAEITPEGGIRIPEELNKQVIEHQQSQIEQQQTLPPVIENPVKRVKSVRTGFESHADTINSLIEDFGKLESPRYGPVRDEYGNVIKHRQKMKGFTPEYLKGLKPETAKDVPLLKKVLDGDPLTDEQYNRIHTLLKAKYEWEAKENARSERDAEKEGLSGGLSQEDVAAETRKAEQDAERQAIQDEEGLGQEGDTSFNPEDFNEQTYASTRPGQRNYGSPEHIEAEMNSQHPWLKKFVGIELPEIIKLYKLTSDDKVPLVRKLGEFLNGKFSPKQIEIFLNKDATKDYQLTKAILAHEIFHFFDFLGKDRTMNRGNILGRLSSAIKYMATLLPESPTSTEKILTEDDRARFRKQAEQLAKGGQPKEPSGPENQFDPAAILAVWNQVSGQDPILLDYVKGLDTEAKKALIKSAMQAAKKGEQVTIDDIKKFNREAKANPSKVAEIYKDLIKKEIKRRKLWEEEVIREELKALSMHWKPFDPAANPTFTKYRFSSVELYADFGSVLLNSPGLAKEMAPNAWNAFFNYLTEKPDVLEALIKVQELAQLGRTDLLDTHIKDILGMFRSGDEAFFSFIEKIRQARTSIWNLTKMILMDKKSIGINVGKELRAKKKIHPKDDIIYAMEENTNLASFAQADAVDFNELIYKPVMNAGLKDDLEVALFLSRIDMGEDRQFLANPLGMTEKDAREYFDNMKENDPDKYNSVIELRERYYDWFKAINQRQGANDLYGPVKVAIMNLNKHYVPFLVTEYEKGYVSAGIAPQIGTFKDIKSPLVSGYLKGISMSIAIERNQLKKKIMRGFMDAGVEMNERRVFVNDRGNFQIEQPSRPDFEVITWKENGKWIAYEIHKDLAASILSRPTEEMMVIGNWLGKLSGNQFFRSVWITFNLGFQFGSNIWRDFFRTWKNFPHLSFIELIQKYKEALPHALNEVKGIYDPLIQQMKREKALSVTFNQLILGKTDEDSQLEYELEKMGVIEPKTGKFDHIPVAKAISQFFDTIRFIGDVLEKTGKIAPYLSKTAQNMPPEKRAYYIRNYASTPNYLNKGTATPATNQLFLFSNMFVQGFRKDFENATNPETRGNFWMKSLIGVAMVKIIMAIMQQIGRASCRERV